MLQAFLNIWRIPELRNKLLFTLSMLGIYRIGFFIPLPGVDQSALANFANQAGGAFGNLIQYVGIFTGGNLGQSTIFGLGIMPYISAAIIMQLLTTVVPRLQELKKEGPAGYQKIQEWTRYATLGLCLVQGMFWISYLQRSVNPALVYADYRGSLLVWVCGVLGLTAGTVFLMWLGEQIDKYGIGNGISLIITAGIVSRMPSAIGMIAADFSVTGDKPYKPMTVIFLLVAFVAVVAGAIVITQGQRRIPIQQAKHTRGRRVYGGQRSYLPLRVNHGGVMPIIFASSLMVLVSMLVGMMGGAFGGGFWSFLSRQFSFEQGFLYIMGYIGLIYFFAYFWTTVQFQPKEMATQLRDHGSFIPGLRPGPRTSEYLETVMERITYVGASFLAVIAVIPTVVAQAMKIPFQVATFLGGTALLIVVSVMLDFVTRIESNLLMRNYQGFLRGGGPGRSGPRLRGRGRT